MSKLKDISNQRFGLLVAKSIDKEHSVSNIKWICQCDCGNTTIVNSSDLLSGHTKSCGCLKHKAYNIKHGLRNERIYHIWRLMKDRCYNKNSHSYGNYGGRGITVCEEWKNDFKAFYDWAISNGYNKDLKSFDCTLDRIDVNGNYEPSNCRWITIKEQSVNKSNTIRVSINGISKPLREWCDIFHCPYNRALQRYIKIMRNDIKCDDFSIIFSEETLYLLPEKTPSHQKHFVDYRERPIIQYDINNNVIKEWSGIKEIKNSGDFNKNAVLNCCYGFALTHKGYKWRYKNDNYPEFHQRK